MIGYLRDAAAFGALLLRRASGARNKAIVANYITRSALRRMFPSVRMPEELLLKMVDCTFIFATGKSELGPYPEVFVDAIYERDARFVARPGDTVVDVGSHIGFYAMRQGGRAAPGRVLAVEPNPDTFSRLLRNMQLNGLSNVTALNAAVGARDGTCSLRLSSGSSEGSTIMESGTVGEYDREVSVDCLTLDSIARRYALGTIDILKIDAEGAEGEILAGGGREALPRTRRIVVETHSRALREHCEGVLSATGFVVVLRVPSGRNVLGENTLLFAVRD